MPDLLKSKTMKARKEHPCSYCGAAAVQPGGTYERETLIYDGRIYDWVTCGPCGELFQTIWAWAGPYGDEGINGETFEEWASDFKDDPEHGEAARAFLTRAFPARALGLWTGVAPMSTDDTQSLAKREVWLLGKCSLCGYFPLVQTERDGFGKIWHYHAGGETAFNAYENEHYGCGGPCDTSENT